mmetsp:Transcript_15897/g.62113  ORF Transcript_15897/g.62113 Transcript_15897/m.62113 type:complete len:768 (+) Transcript_15897:113-2416(+)|eukprot:CAMPEP_0114613514 /NCGR_PEP_ID=MMETSP0168-20121206/5170_1 /TAXON_ID=95228 ORGANISM="Vannella sp., Strain DIVA3 517/6/12" /NCGR_SAMPLE_ID=MMETSP0168 /ASSEMBLY_ACC=CAM_ASM_000044 /LENGTH=767 /DNA_ID=CAMNT_0001824519 /DNA_START=96 /DNA_END=2399 /DNA_ORIENTATION=+
MAEYSFSFADDDTSSISDFASDSETLCTDTETTDDERGHTSTIMDASSYFENNAPTAAEEEAFVEWCALLGESSPEAQLWSSSKQTGDEIFELEVEHDDNDAPWLPKKASLSPIAQTEVQMHVSPRPLTRGPSSIEVAATTELSYEEQIQLRQAIFTFFFRLGISLHHVTPKHIRTVKSLSSDALADASQPVAIPVSQSSENRHLWWCTPSKKDDLPNEDDSTAAARPYSVKLIMSPVPVCHVFVVKKRASKPLGLRFDRSAEKKHLARELRQIAGDLQGGRDKSSCESILKVLLGDQNKHSKVDRFSYKIRHGSLELVDSTGASVRARQRKLYYQCLFNWAGKDVSNSRTLPACHVLARLAFPVELVNGIRDRLYAEGVIWQIIAFAQQGLVPLHRPLEMKDVDFDHMISKGAGGRVFLGHQKAVGEEVMTPCRAISVPERSRTHGGFTRKMRRRLSGLASSAGSEKSRRPEEAADVRGLSPYSSSPDLLNAAGPLASTGGLLAEESAVTSVAIKSTHEDFVGFEKHEFLFEVALMSARVHAHILPCLGAHVDGPSYFMTSPFQARGSLEQVLREVYEPFPWRLRLKVLLVTAQVLEFLHRHKIMHRDLKSANILLGESENAIYLTDFGTARFFDKSYDSSPLEPRIGTPGWMAPEMFAMQKYTSKVDVFSFGIVISEMLTRQPPFAQFVGARADLPDRIARGERPILKLPKLGFGGSGHEEECPPAVEEALIDLAQRCWAHQPSKRPTFAKIVPAIAALCHTAAR